MKCTCAVADSFNVRVADLIDPACPTHGCTMSQCPLNDLKRLEPVPMSEIDSLIMESISEVTFNGRIVNMITSPYGPREIARKLFNNYDIRRKG